MTGQQSPARNIRPADLPALALLYLFFVLARFAVALLIQNPLIPTDELIYKNMAYSFFKTGSFYNTESLGFSTDLPNVLYPLLLSLSFSSHNSFFAAMKLINSLLINAAIFPTYLIANEFLPKGRAFLVAIVIMMLPSLNFINFIATDGLNLPLFLFCFLFAYRNMMQPQIKYGALSGLFLALLFLNKPGAIGFLVGLLLTYLLLSLYLFIRKEMQLLKGMLTSLLTTILAFFCLAIVLSLALKGNVSYNLGVYKTIPTVLGASKAALHHILLMGFAHFNTFFFIYFVPFIVTLFGLAQTLKGKNIHRVYPLLSFLSLGISLFVIYVLFTAKFMVTIYNSEHFQRLHGRYYFMTYPFFLISFAIFCDKIKWNVRNSIVFLSAYAGIVLLNLSYFLPKYVSLGLTIFDNPDLSWYIPPSSMAKIVTAFSVVAVVVYFMFREKRPVAPFFAVYAMLMLFTNYGEIRNIVHYDMLNSKRANSNRHLIQRTISDPGASVAVVDSFIGDRLWMAFWLPYNYKATYDLPRGSAIAKEMIPEETQYVVLFDQYRVEFLGDEVGRGNNCVIIKTR